MSDVYLWETYDRLGREALNKRDLPEALQAFRSAVAVAEEIGAHDRLVLSLRNLAAIMAELGQDGDSHELLMRTLDVALEALGPEHSQSVETKRDLSHACSKLGYLQKAESYLRDVLEMEISQGSKQQIPETLVSLAQMAQSREDFGQAADYYQRVVKLRSQQLGEEHPDVAQALLWLSTTLYQDGRSAEAALSMDRAFKLLEKQFEGEPTHLAQSLLAGAQLMVESGQLDVALLHQKRALDLLARSLEPEASEVWEARELIATTLAGLGKVEESIELLEFCLRNREQGDGPHAGALHKNLGGLYLTLGRVPEAEQYYSKASELLLRSLGKEHPAYLATQEERVQLYHFSKRPHEALKIALSTIKATESRYGPGHPNVAQTYASTALLAHNAEEWDTALELMRAAEKIWSSLHPQPEDVLANCRANIATCLLKLGRIEEAGKVLDQAEESAGPSLRPVIANLRKELSNHSLETESDPMKEAEPEQDEEYSLPDIEGLEEFGDFPVAAADPDGEYALPDVIGELETEDDSFTEFDMFPDTFTESETPVVAKLQELEVSEPVQAVKLEDELEIEEPAVSQEVIEPESSEELVELAEVQETDQSEPSAELEAPAVSEPLAVSEELDLPEASEELDLFQELDSPEELDPPEEAAEAPEAAEAAEAQESPEAATAEAPSSSWHDDKIERRAAPRNPLSLNRFFEIKVSLPSENRSEEVKSFLVDLGPGGIRINSDAPFPPEKELTLTLPEEVLGKETSLQAEVVWQKPLYGESFLQGLAFLGLTNDQEELLSQKLDLDNGNSRPNSRQHFRLYRPFPIRLLAEGQEDWLNSYATDLSIEGLGTRLKTPLEQGNGVKLRLELDFELPTVEVEAKVAWSKSGDNGVSHGLQFATIGPVEAKTIKRYIDRCLEFSPD